MPADEHIENELKFEIARPPETERVAEICARRGLNLFSGHAFRQVDEYADAASLSLLERRIGLRCRSVGGHSVLTVKMERAGQEAAWHSRVEISENVAGINWPIEARDLPAAIRMRVEPFVLDEMLRPIARLETERSVHRIEDPSSGTSVEMMIDAVTVRDVDGDQQHAFSEIEIEGDPGSAFPFQSFVEELRGAFALEPLRTNKLERAMTLLGLGTAQRTEAPQRDGSTPIESAVRHMLARHLERATVEEVAVLVGGDVEAVHDMRVALRRFRSAAKTFKGAFDQEELARRIEVIRHTARVLGDVRDIDVFSEARPSMTDGLPQTMLEDLEPFFADIKKSHERASRRAADWLRSRRRLRAVAKLRRFILGKERSRSSGFSVKDVAPGLLIALQRKVTKNGRRITPSSPAEEIHRLRIVMKRLRYACDGLAEMLGRGLADYARAIAEVQDVLGAVNDAHVQWQFVLERARSASKRMPKRTLLAVGALAGNLARLESSARARLPAAWKAFSKSEVQRLFEKSVGI